MDIEVLGIGPVKTVSSVVGPDEVGAVVCARADYRNRAPRYAR